MYCATLDCWQLRNCSRHNNFTPNNNHVLMDCLQEHYNFQLQHLATLITQTRHALDIEIAAEKSRRDALNVYSQAIHDLYTQRMDYNDNMRSYQHDKEILCTLKDSMVLNKSSS